MKKQKRDPSVKFCAACDVRPAIKRCDECDHPICEKCGCGEADAHAA